jgi:hypothetical protein
MWALTRVQEAVSLTVLGQGTPMVVLEIPVAVAAVIRVAVEVVVGVGEDPPKDDEDLLLPLCDFPILPGCSQTNLWARYEAHDWTWGFISRSRGKKIHANFRIPLQAESENHVNSEKRKAGGGL